MTRWIEIDPHDTLFFRDGRPFNQDEHGANRASSLFPPSPRTTAMMFRAALARGQDWPGPQRGGWKDQQWDDKPDDFVQILGDKADGLGRLTCKSPRLFYKGNPLYPVPLALVGKFEGDKIVEITVLIPSKGKGINTDGGKIRLPVLPENKDGGGWKALEGFYMTQTGLEAFLAERPVEIEEIIPAHKIFQQENRIGIARCREKHITKKGMLYETDHIRLCKNISLVAGFEISEGGEDWEVNPVQPFGGEGRFAWLGELEKDKALSIVRSPKPAIQGDEVCYTVILLSPMTTDKNPFKKPDDALPGKLVSACIGKPVSYGGWCSIENKPLTLKPYIPAGTLWFMKASKQDFEEWEKPEALGAETAFGFGEYCIGNWQDREEQV